MINFVRKLLNVFLLKLVFFFISFVIVRSYCIYFVLKIFIFFLYKYMCVSIVVNCIYFYYYLFVIFVINSCGWGGFFILRYCGRLGESEY